MSREPTKIDATAICREIDMLLLNVPEMAEDETLRRDMIEASTDAFTLLESLVKRDGECDAHLGSLAVYIDVLIARRERLTRRHEGYRLLMRRLMEAADLPKVTLPIATLSLVVGKPRVVIADENALPADCFRVKKEPNRSAIKAALEAGKTVPGAMLSNSEPHLTVRIR